MKKETKKTLQRMMWSLLIGGVALMNAVIAQSFMFNAVITGDWVDLIYSALCWSVPLICLKKFDPWVRMLSE